MKGHIKDVGVRFIEPKRKEIRLKSYDYKSDGYYFVTISTYKQKPNIHSYQDEVERILFSLPHQFSGLTIDWYILMPTHIHVIFVFNRIRVALGEVVRTFKALVTRNTEKPFWQRNYYEHVIRTEDALLKIRKYIEDNPLVEKIRFEDFYKDEPDKSDSGKGGERQ